MVADHIDEEVGAELLNPKQLELLHGLLGQGDKGARPEHREDLALDLHAYIESELEPHQPDMRGEILSVGKYDLTGILDCESRWQASKGFDGWTADNLVGVVVHRAIEHYFVNSVHLVPIDLIEHVLGWMAQNDKPRGVQEYLAGVELADRVDLVNAANNSFVAFCDHWPPIQKNWRPRFEQWSNYDQLLGGALELRAKHDFALGQPRGTTARTVIVDVKTGKASGAHPAEARFYALVETLRARVPPFKVASYYTRTGSAPEQIVTEDMLFQVADSLIETVKRIWTIAAGRDPSRVPGGLCEWCPLYLECEEGQRHVAQRFV